MNAITLWQPYATLVALGVKRWETRGWRTEHRGRLAIHAAAAFPQPMRALVTQAPAIRYALRSFRPPFPRGAVVAIVDVVACIRAEDVLDQMDLGDDFGHDLLPQLHFGDFTPGRFVWKLANLRRLKTPIPAAGAQKLWEWKAPENLDALLAV